MDGLFTSMTCFLPPSWSCHFQCWPRLTLCPTWTREPSGQTEGGRPPPNEKGAGRAEGPKLKPPLGASLRAEGPMKPPLGASLRAEGPKLKPPLGAAVRIEGPKLKPTLGAAIRAEEPKLKPPLGASVRSAGPKLKAGTAWAPKAEALARWEPNAGKPADGAGSNVPTRPRGPVECGGGVTRPRPGGARGTNGIGSSSVGSSPRINSHSRAVSALRAPAIRARRART